MIKLFKSKDIPPAKMQSPTPTIFSQYFSNFSASSILAPEAIRAQTIAPAKEPANTVVSYIDI